MQNRMRSPVLWIALAALIVTCAEVFFRIDISEQVNHVLEAVLMVLIAFGIVNNPTEKDHF